jgi:hypothetical protein
MSIPTRQIADASIGRSHRQQMPAACTSPRDPQTTHVPSRRSAPAHQGNRAGGAADAGRADDGGGRPTDPPRSSSRATLHARSCNRVSLPVSPPPASDQNRRIVREPATTPDPDAPRVDGYCSAGRVASRPDWPRPRASNRPAIETPAAASDPVRRRHPRHASGQTERPATPRAGRIPSCSSTPPAPRTPEALRTSASVTSTLGCHLYIAATQKRPIRWILENQRVADKTGYGKSPRCAIFRGAGEAFRFPWAGRQCRDVALSF